MTAKKRKPGRPPEVNQKTKQRIIDMMIEGLTVVTAARKIGVVQQTIYKWKSKDPEFAQAMDSAREYASEVRVDSMIDIASDRSRDVIVDKDGNERPNTAAVQRDRLMIDTIKKMGVYYNPKKFGEKQQIDVTTNGENIFGGIMITPPKTEDDDEL